MRTKEKAIASRANQIESNPTGAEMRRRLVARDVLGRRFDSFSHSSNPFDPYFKDVDACSAALAQNGNRRSGWHQHFEIRMKKRIENGLNGAYQTHSLRRCAGAKTTDL